jgi:hypothetical protein
MLTDDEAIKSIERSITKISDLKRGSPLSSEHVQWDLDTLSLLEEIFGTNSRIYSSFKMLTSRASSLSPYIDVESPIEHDAYRNQLEMARGILNSGIHEVQKKGTKKVYKAKDSPDENIVIVSLIGNQLRKTMRDKPNNEKEVQDKLEDLFIGAGLDRQFVRETIHVPYSTKSSIPDFTFNNLNTAVEVKLCKSDDNEKKIISEINDDIVTYRTKFLNIIFAVYDLGIIINQDKFKSDIEANNVVVVIVKH